MNWTHSSVLTFAQSNDPVCEVQKKVRELVFSAMARGWSGPPFDPFALAKIIDIEVTPNEEIRDARLVPLSAHKTAIEYNPNRPISRIRYSVAHEISHTIFPDFRDKIRNRASREEMSKDEWQLEMLCNIGAAEILMPVGTIQNENFTEAGIDLALSLQRKYSVSTEAILRRMIALTEKPSVMFCTSRKTDESQEYFLNYAIPSKTWTGKVPEKQLLESTCLRECTAVGYTAKNILSSKARKLSIECVGIPPYPEQRYPRVVGLVSANVKAKAHKIEYLKGNALEPRGQGISLILQIVNDATPRWGGGFAREVRKTWPLVQQDFVDWVTKAKANLRLGNSRIAKADAQIFVASMIAQRGFGPSDTPRIRYQSLEQGLRQVAKFAKEKNAKIHMPRIGAGLAGGSWAIVSELVESCLVAEGLSVTVYDLP